MTLAFWSLLSGSVVLCRHECYTLNAAQSRDVGQWSTWTFGGHIATAPFWLICLPGRGVASLIKEKYLRQWRLYNHARFFHTIITLSALNLWNPEQQKIYTTILSLAASRNMHKLRYFLAFLFMIFWSLEVISIDIVVSKATRETIETHWNTDGPTSSHGINSPGDIWFLKLLAFRALLLSWHSVGLALPREPS